MLLIILFSMALMAICGFTFAAFQIIWDLLGSLLPDTINVVGAVVPAALVVYATALLLFALIFLLFVFLFLLFDRLILQPMKSISEAMQEFAEHGRQVKLPSFSRATTEVSSFVDAFMQYTDSVERVHSQDMELSRVKSDFISTAAHQLRTPLTGIRWAMEALEQTNVTEDQKALVKSAVDKSHELVNIVSTLLDISSIEAGKYKYKMEPVDVGVLLNEVAQDFNPLATTRQVKLYYAKGETLLPKAKADRERIKWVLNNLVENAIRYTPAGGTVQLTLETSVGKIFIRVHDTGIGIDAKDRANIFERFYRTDNAIAKENSGNGLGLYIARTIATDHGGDLDFASNTDGPGTTFTLTLPVAN